MCLNTHFKGTIPALLWTDNRNEFLDIPFALLFPPFGLQTNPGATSQRHWLQMVGLLLCVPKDLHSHRQLIGRAGSRCIMGGRGSPQVIS